MSNLGKSSSLPMYIASASLFLSAVSPLKVLALSNTLSTITSNDFKLNHKNGSLILTFNNSSLSSKITKVRILNEKTNKEKEFTLNGSSYEVSTDNMSDGIYSLIFNYKDSNSNIKEVKTPIYIDFTDVSSNELYLTSLNPIITFKTINGANKINAKFNILNIKDTIIGGRVLDERGNEIGYLENKETPRNYIFNLQSKNLNLNQTYYIEYTLKDSDGNTKTLKIPFMYLPNGVRVTPYNRNSFLYKSSLKGNNKVDLTINSKDVNNGDITFSYEDSGLYISPAYDSNGNILLKDINTNSLIKMTFRLSNGDSEDILFKAPNTTSNNYTSLPLINFINAQSLSLKEGETLNLPLIKEDLATVGFTTPNTYIKFISKDDFGSELSLTDEKRISLSSSSIGLDVNSNINNIDSNNRVYLKIYNGNKSYLIPFSIDNINPSAKALSFDVIKNSSINNKVSLTLKPNSNILSSNEVFKDTDTLLINNSHHGKLSDDKKSFLFNLDANVLKNGVNSYTLIKDNLSVTGEFLIKGSDEEIKIKPLIDDLNIKTNTNSELLITLDINDDFLTNSINSIILKDELGKTISLKSSVKTLNGNKYIELFIDPPNQMLPNKTYTLEFKNSQGDFKSTFIFNDKTNYTQTIDMKFNSENSFTLNNLDKIPGASNYEFNIKVLEYYNKNNVLYENYPQTYYGEKLSSSIKRTLSNGKYFVDGERYLIRLTNTSTGDVFESDLVFRQNDIVNDGGNNNQGSITVSSGNINVSGDGINFNYSKPSSKNISLVNTNIKGINASYSNGKINIEGLIPNKLYRNFTLMVNFSDGTNQTIKLDEFTTGSSSDSLKNYISKVYKTSLTPINETNKYSIRYADEDGFNYWYSMLKNQTFSGPEFIFRVLDANEFNRVHTSSQNKIRALYPIVVNRDGDTNGVNFWINEFNNNLKSLSSEDLALKVTLAKMVNEDEPKKLFSSLGIRLY